MGHSLVVGVIGDYDPGSPNHLATTQALVDAGQSLATVVEITWLPTSMLGSRTAESGTALDRCSALWCAPGSPYESMEGALAAIRYARENDVPYVGTCGGFQHTLIEYARNVLGISDAEHQETAPDAPRLVISRLACSLVGKREAVRIVPGSLASRAFGRERTVEEFRCNFGLNPAFRDAFAASALRVVGFDDTGESRIVELPDRRFFMATLFLPQLSSTAAAPHPLIVAYLQAALAFARDRTINRLASQG